MITIDRPQPPQEQCKMQERSEWVRRERISMKLWSYSFLLGLDGLHWIAPVGDKACSRPLISSLSLITTK